MLTNHMRFVLLVLKYESKRELDDTSSNHTILIKI